MADKPKHPRLPAHNARVLRLARDYDQKYRPVLVPIAKHMNLETGDSFPRVATIMRESARYTDKRKPLSRASVFRLLAEMEAVGAIKTEPRFGPTGRQRSSIRYLDVHVAIRFGQPVEHLWDAPVAEDETPGETPHKTPDETPITLSISLNNSPSNSVKTGDKGASPNREIEREDQAEILARAEASSPGMCNTYTYWQVKRSGNWVYFRADKPSRQTPPKSAKQVTLSPAEAKFMWSHLPTRHDHVGFLKSSKAARQFMMAHHDRPDARAEREAWQARKEEYAKKQETQRAAEHSERAPLVARYAELYGQDPEDVEERARIMEGRLAVIWLEDKIAKHPAWAAEQAARAAKEIELAPERALLLARYAEMTGRDVESIAGLVDRQGSNTAAVAWLQRMIAQTELKKRA